MENLFCQCTNTHYSSLIMCSSISTQHIAIVFFLADFSFNFPLSLLVILDLHIYNLLLPIHVHTYHNFNIPKLYLTPMYSQYVYPFLCVISFNNSPTFIQNLGFFFTFTTMVINVQCQFCWCSFEYIPSTLLYAFIKVFMHQIYVSYPYKCYIYFWSSWQFLFAIKSH